MATEGSREVQGALWSQAAKIRDSLLAGHVRPLWEAVLTQAGAGPGVRLLDAGCGAGQACALAVDRGADVTGIDAAPTMIELATSRCPGARFQVADIQALPFEDASFDAVISIHCVHFAADPQVAIFELHRVCRPGGVVVISSCGEPHECATSELVRALIAVAPPEMRSDQRFTDPYRLADAGTIERMCSAVGLRPAHVGKVDCPLEWPSMDVAIEAGQSAGVYHAAATVVGEETVKAALRAVFERHIVDGGRVRLDNRYRYVRNER